MSRRVNVFRDRIREWLEVRDVRGFVDLPPPARILIVLIGVVMAVEVIKWLLDGILA